MLAANVCASEFLEFNEQPALYRIHEGPSAEKLERLRTFLAEFGLDLPGGDDPAASDFARLIDRIKGRPDRELLQTVMLRSLRQAMYSPDNVGHFGLAYEAYTHFTSPIRRYPDLIVHRAIKAVLARQNSRRKNVEAEALAALDLDEVGAHCSATERRADEATRDVEQWLKCFFMQDRVGEQFTGSVSAVVPFGIFVALDDVFIEGLVHISELGSDYFHFDEARHELVGERTGQRFRLADRVGVQLARVDLETRKIDFRLVEAAAPVTQRRGKTARDATRETTRAVAARPSVVEDPAEGELLSWRELQGVKSGEQRPAKGAAARNRKPGSRAAPARTESGHKSGKAPTETRRKSAPPKSARKAKSNKKSGGRRG